MWFQAGLALALGASVAQSAAVTSSSSCKVVEYKVSGSAMNFNITGLSFNDPAAFIAQVTALGFESIPVSGTQTLSGIYCPAKVKNANNAKLQVLFHSIVHNRAGWAALGDIENGNAPYKPEQYSWVNFANNLGYPTLHIDRLGDGFSSHPDPILVVQGPYEDAIYHDLATQLRAGTNKAVPKYSTLIWVGNSYGSQLGTTSAQKYPNDWDSYVLTGFSKAVDADIGGVALVMPAPAAVAMPARFGTLAPGYVVPTSRQGQINSFFGSPAQVSFDPKIANLFYDRNDVVSFGQFFSVYAPFQTATAPNYKKRVLVLTGEQDQAFCGPGSPVIGPAHCGPLLKEAGSLFPAAEYNYKSVDKTGHGIQLHYSSLKVFTIAHRFLAGERFQGGAPA